MEIRYRSSGSDRVASGSADPEVTVLSATMGLKKTGKKIAMPYMGIDRWEGGKLKEGWLFFDTTSFAAQLGLK